MKDLLFAFDRRSYDTIDSGGEQSRFLPPFLILAVFGGIR